MIVSFFVHGTPAPQGSKSAFIVNKGLPTQRAVLVESAKKKVKPWRTAVAAAAEAAMDGREPFDCTLFAFMRFDFERPKGHYGARGALKPRAPRFLGVSPDLSKLMRSTEDALHGSVLRNDSRIAVCIPIKVYTERASGASIRIATSMQELLVACLPELEHLADMDLLLEPSPQAPEQRTLFDEPEPSRPAEPSRVDEAPEIT